MWKAIEMSVDITDMIKRKIDTVWVNPELDYMEPGWDVNGRKFVHIKAAQNRLMRFMPYIERAFPETASRRGIIESDLLDIPEFVNSMKNDGISIDGRVLLKDDAHLPISGSVKARGGIYEVLLHAEQLALQKGMLKVTDNYSMLATDDFKRFYNNYVIQVGSTGNLGLSIGIMGAVLGFKVIVHMSRDAKEWKKKRLREVGAHVIEYDGDYTKAVTEGRKLSESEENSYFIDDENSENLFMGYATAALRLKVQLYKKGVTVDSKHPLFVYIPCGVGGAPGGITFGLKQLFGDDVHCFFIEPVEAPCFMLGMSTGKNNYISVSEYGLTGNTVADGLAVQRASGFSCYMMESLLSGCATVSDEMMLKYQKQLYDTEKIYIEPSACAGIHMFRHINDNELLKDYIRDRIPEGCMSNATHIIWATGGGMVPREEYEVL